MSKKLSYLFLVLSLLLNLSLWAVETPSVSTATPLKYRLKKGCMLQILSTRYSGYSYDANKSVSAEQLKEMIEAGRLAPSSYNEQPWNFIICDRTTHLKAYEDVLSTLVEPNQKWAQNASVFIVSVAASKSAHNGKPNRFGQYDTGAAAYGMMLQATALGLMAHQMGGFDDVKLKTLFSIPDDFTVMSVMAVGYPVANDVQPARQRKPLQDNFFMGKWGAQKDNSGAN